MQVLTVRHFYLVSKTDICDSEFLILWGPFLSVEQQKADFLVARCLLSRPSQS